MSSDEGGDSVCYVTKTMSNAAHSFNKLLTQPKYTSKSRASGEPDDGTKRLRRMILVEGIPSKVASFGP